MAVNIHVARVEFVTVNPVSQQVVDKNSPTTKIADLLRTCSEHRLVVDTNIPNTASRPTVKKYLELEAAADYKLQYMDQNTIITYEVV